MAWNKKITETMKERDHLEFEHDMVVDRTLHIDTLRKIHAELHTEPCNHEAP